MSKIIIACQTIKDEVCLALKETGVDYPVLFIESGLHNYPDLLRRRLQESINQLENVDTVLFAFGYCGNSLVGLTSPTAALIIPKADDCISLLLGSHELRMSLSREMGTYFLTKGWLDNEKSLLSEYQHYIEKYGSAKADMIIKTMLHHYKRLMIIDTQTCQPEEIMAKTENFAKSLELQHETITGSSRFLKKLFTGPWDEEFITVKPGDTVTLEHTLTEEKMFSNL
ncbi:DUF1638 domain-containing protein [Dehalobacter sp. TBBPA1]|uniref:DUF1638 domain-containing protein n=1 Tax=Dehalobacter sp. TBBPA1 TaxID=3235037 RepID=UPI0034A1186B